MATRPKRGRTERSDCSEVRVELCTLAAENIPQLNELGMYLRPELFPNFGNEDNDINGCSAEPIDSTLGFHCMGGTKEFIDEVRNRVLFPIVNSDFVARHGRYPPKGILLHGPPGTGKTLFAKCLAAELSRLGTGKYTFFMRRGSDVLSCWVGSSEKNIRNVFARAVQCKPSIIFFDEADGLVPNRNSLQNTVQVYTNVVTSILSEMDKLKRGEVIVIFATNRTEALDPAIKRPGRVDVTLAFLPPNADERKKIIEIYTKNWGPSIPSQTLLNQLAFATNGFTGADLDKLCSEAFFACVRRTQTNCGFSVCRVSGNEMITESDWLEALNSMSPSQSNVFSSYAQVLEVSSFIQPLIRCSTGAIVELLEGNNTLQNKVTGGPNCFLIWNSSPKCNEILDLLVIPAVFGGLSGQTVFVLNEEAMLQEYQHFSINSIVNIAAQAKACSKSCILFIPRIDTLAARLAGECPILKRVLFDTGNKTTLVVATAGCDVDRLPFDIQPLFDGTRKTYRLDKPTENERTQFYSPIFTNSGINPPELKSRCGSTADHLLEEVVALTDHDDLWSMITLHRELTLTTRKAHKSNKERVADLRAIVEGYRRNRLSASKK